MCGIVGFFDPARTGDTDFMRATVRVMRDTLIHRGPDDSGIWVDTAAGIALGHRRLSIIDLSREGHQPMVSGSGRYVIVYNGEVYNSPALRHELGQKGYDFRGHSDTETILCAIEVWGLEKALVRFIGMFALAVWDCEEKTLVLVRDRIGIKPLYYGWESGVFLFASELKAIKAYPSFNASISRDSLTLLLRHNCIPAPYSIYQGISKLLPGHILRISQMDVENYNLEVKQQIFWNPKDVGEKRQSGIFEENESDAVAELDSLMRDAVRIRMLSDVPLGAFLSGGIDSSTIVALMQTQSLGSVKTFTIGFEDENYDEAKQARAVAGHLGTDHTELYVTHREAMDVIPRLAQLYDEPFGDSSQIPTFLIAEMTRRHVSVCLSGDGGDELFGGYNRHFWGPEIWDRMDRIPAPLRSLVSKGMEAVPPHIWDSVYGLTESVLPIKFRTRLAGEKMQKLARILSANTPEDMYLLLASHWTEPGRVVLEATEPATSLTHPVYSPNGFDFAHRMMYLDLITYLPDDILTKVDRASMGVSLEARVPILDHRVVEFAWRLPLSMKIRNGMGKWILRQVLYKYVPEKLVERPKSGFAVPIDSWLRGPLRDWAEELLAEKRLKDEGFFDPFPVRNKWREHLSGRRNWQYHLWDVLVFQAWLDAQ